MAEIKSTIDLVMEKTKGLSLTEEDKQNLKIEEDRRKAQAQVNRYLQGDMGLDEFLEHGASSPEVIQREIFRVLVEALRPGREAFSRCLEALDRWKGQPCRVPLKRLKDLSIRFGKALQKRKRKVKAELWETLASRGVQGSAVEPNVEVSVQWDRALRDLDREFESQLEEIKKELLAALGVGERT